MKAIIIETLKKREELKRKKDLRKKRIKKYSEGAMLFFKYALNSCKIISPFDYVNRTGFVESLNAINYLIK